ncbi:MAG: KpsF/GutQ family sugar-phosphate isomerase [Hyphomicrobiales bacterium]|nr:KpsF/GutQ family sugar-phosphate isomerase [Hyphomicrobiales bacterium]
MRQDPTPDTLSTKGEKRGGTAVSATLSALRTIELEIDGLNAVKSALAAELGERLNKTVRLIQDRPGRVIVTGLGKSGHIGQKLAATLASTGTPAFFVHPSEASHGDLGMITRDDAIVAISWSGETVELGNILSYSRRFDVPLIAITSRSTSALGKASDIVLELPVAIEACPHGLAPTTSTAMQLAMGDCLAIALLEARGFTAADFKIFHPGGKLGANLRYASDLMHGVEKLPLAHTGQTMSEALVTMTEKSFGCVGVVDVEGRLTGMITDGDLRRHMSANLLSEKVEEVMTKSPRTIQPNTLASSALQTMNSCGKGITAIFVVEDSKPVGILHVHDLLRAGVV